MLHYFDYICNAIKNNKNLLINIRNMSQLDLSKYGITGVKEVLHNPSYEVLFAEETKPGLEGFEV